MKVSLKNSIVFMAFTLVLACVMSCIDEIDLDTVSSNELKEILVVEGTLTNEVKNHQVRLSRIDSLVDLQLDSVFTPYIPVRDIDRDFVNYVENAQVVVVDASGIEYDFNESSPGIYESVVQFAAANDHTYQLEITTAEGRGYSSKPMAINGTSEIINAYAEKVISDTGVEGIGIFIDNESVVGNAKNFRYNYDETYKIIAPGWSPYEFKLTNYDPCALPVPTYNLEIVERQEEQQTCYNTVTSNTIIQTQLNTTGSGVDKFMVRFIGKDNFIISHRYSIEISQLVTGIASYGFYEQLNDFSQTGNIFSQVQPGFIEGNVTSNDGVQGSVIGFFDVASTSKKRMFFNYTDFYANEPLPPFPFNCGVHSSLESHRSYCDSGPDGGNACPQSIIEMVNLDLIRYVDENTQNIGTCPGPYTYVPSICGDCTTMGSNVVPEFWIE